MIAFAGCDEDDDGSSDASGGDSNGGECFAGELGCACVDGELCEAGLECVAQICRDMDGGNDDGSADGGGSGAGGIDACNDNADCHVTEVCVFETCTPSDVFDWRFAVVSYVPGSCADGWGSAELFYRYLQDGSVVATSPTGSCPARWPTLYQEYSPHSPFELEVWELDAFFDDYLTSLCWADPSTLTSCGPVPDIILHEGGYVGAGDSSLHAFELVFEPILE